jgi:uncharacterized protein DUF5672
VGCPGDAGEGGRVIMLDLPQVTLCCVDALNHALALRALARCRRDVRFGRTVFVTDAIPRDVDVPDGINVVVAGAIRSQEDYSRLVMKGLLPHFESTHVLLVQWDGYVVHPGAWSPEFLDTDYVGAPWPDAPKGGNVGNGGFSLRSRKLLTTLTDDRFPLLTYNEDTTICTLHRPRLEAEFGIRFASEEMARRFSFELDDRDVRAGIQTFGFHGVFNLHRVEGEDEIVTMAESFSNAIAASPAIALLLQRLVEARQWRAAVAVGQRVLAVRDDDRVAALVVEARDAQARARAQAPRRGFATRLIERLRVPRERA